MKLVVAEPESGALSHHLGEYRELFSAALVVTELGRAVRRATDGMARDAPTVLNRLAEVVDALALLDVDRRLLDDAAMVEPAMLRTLDAIHIAAARALGEDLTAFITYDTRLGAAAAELGMTVISPS